MAGKAKQKKKATTAEKPLKQATRSNGMQRRRSPEEVQASAESGLLDVNMKHDIVGVVLIVCAVVLLLLASLPSDGALISSFASGAVHLVFGVGCYILPVILFIVGIVYLTKFKHGGMPGRVALGLAIVFVALLGFIALFAPISTLGEDTPELLFREPALVGYGGYIGSALAWCGIVLFGRIISGVILIGVMAVGLIIVGFSISNIVEHVKARRSNPAAGLFSSASGTGGFARIRRTPDAERRAYVYDAHAFVGQDKDSPAGIDGALTAVIGDGHGGQQRRHSGDQGKHTVRMPASRAEDSDITRPLVVPPLSDTAETGASTAALTRKLGSSESAMTVKLETKKPQAKKQTKPDRGVGVTTALPTPQDGFVLPDMTLLNMSKKSKKGAAKKELASVAERLQQVMSDFGIDAQVVDWIAGPTVTLFEVDLPSGVRVSRITALSDDIALALASPGVRIFAPVPGTNYVGIEVPNAKRETVLLADVLKDAGSGPLQIAIGKDVEGNSIVSDLAKMPHLLIGGTTGSGKSVSINAMIMSILMRATPSEVRFIMIDPKRVEFTPYNGIPHLYVPVVTEPREAASALSWGVAEMERRLKVFSSIGARNIAQYNAKAQEQKAAASSGNADASDDDVLEEMPYIVIIIDELADLMMNVGKEVEVSISRIAQLARAAGIHLIVATQRPSTNVVTGLIKANITNRIAFNVASSIDSRVVLDTPGAESLIGLGDLLLSKPELARPQRIQGCYVSEDEINRVVDFIKGQSAPEYHTEILQTNLYSLGDTNPAGGSASGSRDPLLWEAAEITVSSGMGSTSNIQRRLKVGYARAGRIMDQLEELGIVGPANGSRPREVLLDETELETVKAFEMADES